MRPSIVIDDPPASQSALDVPGDGHLTSLQVFRHQNFGDRLLSCCLLQGGDSVHDCAHALTGRLLTLRSTRMTRKITLTASPVTVSLLLGSN